MSVRVMLWALKLHAPLPHAVARVLMVLAEHAGDDGRKCYPSLDTIAAVAQMDRRTVTRSLEKLEQDGIIAREVGGGRSRSTAYTLNLTLPSGTENSGVMSQFQERETGAALSETGAALLGNRGVTPHEPVLNLSLTKKLPSVATRAPRAAKGSRLPDDWQPDIACRAYAIERNLDPDKLAEDFRGYWHSPDARKPMRKDWLGTWQRRCRDVMGRSAFALRGPAPVPQTGPRGGSGRQSREEILRAAGLWPPDDDAQPGLPMIRNGAKPDA